MGAWLGRRNEPRVDFREAVRVIWPGEVSGVVARAVDLSLAGIRVDAPTPAPCPVGSDVLCDVTLPTGPRLLRGRVAHRRVLSPAKVGMGIEFVDLSPLEVAELRDVVDESPELAPRAPQKVKVRFAGTEQIVRARAVPTRDGFRLSTALAFLKRDTEVAISLSPEAGVGARGWVSGVALERGGEGEGGEAGAPKLVIDVRVDAADPFHFDVGTDRSSALTPVVEPLAELRETPVEAVPEHVWEVDELSTPEPAPLAVAASREEPTPTFVEPTGSAPEVEDHDATEILDVTPGRPTRWRALGAGMLAGVIVLGAFVGAVLLARSLGPTSTPPPSISPPVIVTTEKAAPAAPVEPPPAPEPVAAAPAPAEAMAPAVPHGAFELALSGSIAGASHYPLRDPDGVVYNLPRARSDLKVGTYHPAVHGLKAVWVRALPGGGTHLRFFFTSAAAAPRVELAKDAVRVTER